MSISRTSPPTWRQPRTLAILFWTGFGFAPFAALLLLVGSSETTIKLALIAGLGSVVLIGLSVALRTDAATVERDVYANMADVEAETRRALNELRNELRRSPPRETPAVAPSPPRPALAAEDREEPRRPRPVQQAPAEYYGSRVDEREAEQYLAETTAVPRQRWEEEFQQSDYERSPRRGQAVEAWRADEPVTGSRRRGVENGWSADEVYNSGPQPRASRDYGMDPQGRGRHYRGDDPRGGGRRYRDDDEVSGEIPARRYREESDPLSGDIPVASGGGRARRREYADSRSRNGGSSYMDTYYGERR